GLLCRPVLEVTAAVDMPTPVSKEKKKGVIEAGEKDVDPELRKNRRKMILKRKKEPFQNVLQSVVETDLYKELKGIKERMSELQSSLLPEKRVLHPITHEQSKVSSSQKSTGQNNLMPSFPNNLPSLMFESDAGPAVNRNKGEMVKASKGEVKVKDKTVRISKPTERKKGIERTHPLQNNPSQIPGVHETWLEMKVMLKALTEMKRENPVYPFNQSVARLFQQLVSSGIDFQTAKRLCRAVQESLSQEDLWDEHTVKTFLKEMIEEMVQVTGPLLSSEINAGKRPLKFVALVGPTGVGKTTTLLKLGAIEMARKTKVILVSIKEEGVKDSEMLMKSAAKMGLPAVEVASWEQLHKMDTDCIEAELILLDTAGRSHLNQKNVASLKKIIPMGISTPLETHLVLSSSTKERDLSDMVDRFSVIPVDSLIFTKIDETQIYGPLFSVIGHKRKPISYLTMGRRVPEDIEVATPQRFSNLVLRNPVQGVSTH
ncbi:MAG: hypothetical protein ACE5FY_06105, partial [Nitrospiria bacterium]